jgi:hypothetical protein
MVTPVCLVRLAFDIAKWGRVSPAKTWIYLLLPNKLGANGGMLQILMQSSEPFAAKGRREKGN